MHSIDQENPDEHSQQVSIMKDIYDNADQIMIWLGDGEGMDHGMRCVHEAASLSCERHKDGCLFPVIDSPLQIHNNPIQHPLTLLHFGCRSYLRVLHIFSC